MSCPPTSYLRRVIGILCVAVTFAGCAGTTPLENESTQSASEIGTRAAAVATQQVGAAYRYGGAGPESFDCSGLVSYAYANAGRRVPRTTGGLWRQMMPVPESNLEVGDVLFFSIEGKMSHVGLYLGDGRFVHAPSSGKEVSIEELDSAFYRDAFVRGGRPL